MLDFVLLGVIVVGMILVGRMVVRKMPDSREYKVAVGIALAASLLLFWINAAVGIIGSENNDANLMYAGVVGIVFVGSVTARFKPRGMAATMFVAAAAQVLVAIVALTGGWGVSGPIWPRDVLGLTAFFAALWVGAGLLFRKAARSESSFQ